MDVRKKTTRPPETTVVPSSRSTESVSRTTAFIKDLIEGKEFEERDLFFELEQAFHDQHRHGGIYVKRYMPEGLNTTEKCLKYQRETTVYNRRMYNKFFLPIWAAAKVENTAYILYPRLTPLTDVLPTLRIDSDPRKEQEIRLKGVLRRCFAPIALAIDALHTPVPNSRTMYYHRDLSISQIYLCESGEGNHVGYGDAMLKLTKLTRGSHEEALNVYDSINTYSFVRKYFHHPDPWSTLDDKLYHRWHDWFSFGVYILDVLLKVLPVREERSSVQRYDKVADYLSFASVLEEYVKTSVKWKLPQTKILLQHYLSIAVMCMSLEGDGEQVMHYEFPADFQERFGPWKSQSFKPYYFEYGLNKWTAQLLWVYDDSRSDDDDRFELSRPAGREEPRRNMNAKAADVCHACILRQSVKIPTRTYRRAKSKPSAAQPEDEDNEEEEESGCKKCDKLCNRYYCSLCYSNGERLFCPNQHGTTSTIIGHYSSFALILYGDEPNDVFKKDARTLENVLKHRLICGIPDENVVLAPIFDENRLGDEKECLTKACDEVRKLIHNRQWIGNRYDYDVDTCVNDAGYTLFIFYSGHGERGEDGKGGHWRAITVKDDEGKDKRYILEREVIDKLLYSIRRCTLNNPFCEAACVEVTYLMDHCYNLKKLLSVADETVGSASAPSSVVVTAAPDEASMYNVKNNSEITRWFCDLLRCVGFHDDSEKKPVCDVCLELKTHIATKCHNAFIDGKCLEIFQWHVCDNNHYESNAPRVLVEVTGKDRKKPIILAHFHPKGIKYRVFPYREGLELEPVDIEFCIEVNCQTVKERIMAELRKKDKKRKEKLYANKTLQISLLANVPKDYSRFSLVSDSDIRSTLDYNLLFYHVITEHTNVILQAKYGDRTIVDTLEDLEISSADVSKMVDECRPERSRLRIPSIACQLPNILVYIVHHLRYKVYEDGVPVNSQPGRQLSASSTQDTKVFQQTTSQDDSDIPDIERLRNSFVGLLFQQPRRREVKSFLTLQWTEVEEEAEMYLKEGRKRAFDINTDSSGHLRVSWDIAAMPSPAIYGEDRRELEESLDDEHVNLPVGASNEEEDDEEEENLAVS